jgi:hypothetical protein
MSRISYCSLEEAWGNNSNNNNNNNIPKINKNNVQKTLDKNNSDLNTNQKNNNFEDDDLNAYKGKSQNDYEILKKDNVKMKKMINQMNYVERNKVPENNINEDYNEYRFNPVNKVNSLYQDEKNYSPFQDDMEKKYLQDKITNLENEFRKYKMFLNNKMNGEDVIEGFANEKSDESQTDIMDLIVLIVIGLILIFIMDSIFKIGKYIGSKKST